MPILTATFGTSPSGQPRRTLTLACGGDGGTILFPLDDVALTARIVGTTAAARLWMRAVRAMWRIVDGDLLPDHLLAKAGSVAARRLTKRLAVSGQEDFDLTECYGPVSFPAAPLAEWIGEVTAANAMPISDCFPT